MFEPSFDDAFAVLRRAVELGVKNIDNSSLYGTGEYNPLVLEYMAPKHHDIDIIIKY
jgi:pyridoxine 4-dehydrogenase